MGWKPAEFYNETLADAQIALAAHYDRVEYETIQRMSLLRRLTYVIANTSGFTKKEIKESDILELPNERAERMRQKAANQFSQEEIDERLARWAKEGPGIKGGKDASDILMKLVK